MMKKVMMVVLIISFAGCATQSKNITAAYVSPLQYQHYNCAQVGQEIGRITRKVNEVSDTQDSTATKDTAAMAVGLVLFWPALFFLASGEDRKNEIGRLKGEYDALENIAIEKECTVVLASIKAAKERKEELEKAQKEKEQKEERDANPRGVK